MRHTFSKKRPTDELESSFCINITFMVFKEGTGYIKRQEEIKKMTIKLNGVCIVVASQALQISFTCLRCAQLSSLCLGSSTQ